MESFTFYLCIVSLCAFVFIVFFAPIFVQSTEPTGNFIKNLNNNNNYYYYYYYNDHCPDNRSYPSRTTQITVYVNI